LVVINDAHHRNRQASSLAHELAHIILCHVPAQAFGEDGLREWNPTQEREAEWLGAALLISEEAALDIVAKRMSSSTASALYRVSEDLVTFRIRVTGARIRVARASEYRPFA
jgi:Zn-dependent peptidase ImmA (M78 family)